MQHSKVVGGSTAKRVIACPGSVALVAKMPPKPSSKYADEGTLLHNVIAEIVMSGNPPEHYLGTKYEDQTLTQELIDDKLTPALAALDQIDPFHGMEIEAETSVNFGDLLPGVFGSTDLIGRIGNRAVVLDWKFGDGVMVDVEDNPQLLFYAAAAMRTEAARWAFDGATEIEMVIVQPPAVKRWVTTPARVAAFELELVQAVKASEKPDAKLAVGDHCRWCTAKPVCPILTGAVDRAVKVQFDALDKQQISIYLQQADLLDSWIAGLRELAQRALDNGQVIPGYKLVAKRGTRKWLDEDKARVALVEAGLKDPDVTTLVSPAVAEKKLKKLPDGLTVSVSSGNTMAPDSDPRPAILQLGQLLKKVL